MDATLHLQSLRVFKTSTLFTPSTTTTTIKQNSWIMSNDNNLLIGIYLNRFVNSIVLAEFSAQYREGLVKSLWAYISGDGSQNSQVIEEIRAHFSRHGNDSDWSTMRALLISLPNQQTTELLISYLQFLLNLVPNSHSTRPPTVPNTGPANLSSPVNGIKTLFQHPNDVLNSQPRPNGDLIDDEAILSFLPNTLVGLDTQMFTFSKDSLTVPSNVSRGKFMLLHELCECAMMYRHLHDSVERLRGKVASPIKAAFLQSLNVKLMAYASHVNNIFQRSPGSLLSVFHDLQDQIVDLRILSHLQEQLEQLNGFKFLEEVHRLAEFGDTQVSCLAQIIYQELKKPYFQYLEHWILRGELIDVNDEFFISFNKEVDHINDIIRFHNERLPLFLGLTEDDCSHVHQIGKTIIFLDKFCKELDWLNAYVKHYSAFIFEKNQGLLSLDKSSLQVLLQTQFRELVNFLNLVAYGKYELFEHLKNLKSVMLIGSSDFVEAINEKGLAMFNEPATSLTSGKLAGLLSSAIKASSIRMLPQRFQLRIDARILDLSHGSIGWDVFTLEYKLFEPSLELLLNNSGQSTQYLRLFNFLWSFRHFHFLLQKNYVDYVRLQKDYIPKLGAKNVHLAKRGISVARRSWFTKCLRTINLIRFRLLNLVSSILTFLCFDLIENCFQEKVVKLVFKKSHKSNPMSVNKGSRKDRQLAIIDKSFAAAFAYEASPTYSDTKRVSLAEVNTVESTLDQITEMHLIYLKSIYDCKLMDESYKGKWSKEPLIDQIFAFMEVLFAFVQSSEEFGSSVVSYVNLLDLSKSTESGAGDAFEGDLEQLHVRLNDLMRVMYKDLYKKNFEQRLIIFTKDLRADLDLKDLSKML